MKPGGSPEDKCGSVIEQLPQGYDTQLRERGTNLLAVRSNSWPLRAAIRNPRILVLDEATASLM